MTDAIINLDLTNSIDVVRALVGDFDKTCPIMSDNMYQQILDMYTEVDESIAEWFAAIYACSIIVRHYAQSGLRSRERVNAVEVEEYGNERYQAYKNTCKWLKANPPIGSGADGLPLFFLGGYCNNGLRQSGISIGWFSSAMLACHAITWENGYFRGYNNGLAFLGTIEVNLCGTCGLGVGSGCCC
ncbi:MAG: hypothetical protein GY714_01660 [Desulfobacterales bacterium]|nr:hypothetical protein [Desulfobacterales bacterium]